MVFLTAIGCAIQRTYKVSPTRYFKRMQLKRLAAKYMGRARNCYVIGVRLKDRAMYYSTRDQEIKEENLDRLFETRLSASCLEHGMDKKYFLTSIAESDINLNRQTLSNLAIYEPRTFQSLTEYVKMRSLEVGLQSTKLGAVEGLESRGVMDNSKKPTS